jgi:hypothetical protein
MLSNYTKLQLRINYTFFENSTIITTKLNQQKMAFHFTERLYHTTKTHIHLFI